MDDASVLAQIVARDERETAHVRRDLGADAGRDRPVSGTQR